MNWTTPFETPGTAGRLRRHSVAPDAGVAKKLSLTAVVMGMVLTVVGGGTWAAFSDTTSSPGNTFSTGAISLTSDREGTAMFNATGLLPGHTPLVECIEVTYTSGPDASVKLYGTTTAPGDLAPYLDLTVEEDTGGDCTAFTPTSTVYATATLDAYPDAYAGGIDAGTWTAGTTKAYRFTVNLQNDGDAQGKDVTQAFIWEAQT